MRGIQDRVDLQWNGQAYPFDPGIGTTDLVAAGISTRVPVELSGLESRQYTFSLTLKLNGSSELHFIPVGKETNIDLKSNWNDPSFDGAFLPDKREVNEKGFTAHWRVLHLNRNYPQAWKGSQYDITYSKFGVKLLLPVDRYLKSTRSVKYASLFIVLTFLIFFILEIINQFRIHPIQYILVGLGLVLFYVLLLSFSEHIGFGPAYLVASAGIILMITLYAKTIFKFLKLALLLGGVLVILYTFIYVILQLSDYALLVGSIGLFLALALLMYLTRKVDWHAIGFNLDKVEK
jgi:inner membrane protein